MPRVDLKNLDVFESQTREGLRRMEVQDIRLVSECTRNRSVAEFIVQMVAKKHQRIFLTRSVASPKTRLLFNLLIEHLFKFVGVEK